ncbi:MAG: YqeG family HAD IIIA-type phosphatase [Oscillospiraceae bacterium]
MGLFTPDFYFEDILRITPQFLAQNGIQGLVLDVDNTLTAHSSQKVSDSIRQWLQLMKENNILLMIASNNYRKRVQPFAEGLGLEYISFACKPSVRSLRYACKKWNLTRKQIAMVGDQIYTDSLAAGLYGVPMLLVKPFAKDVKRGILFKRHLEKPIIKRYHRRGGKLL